MFNEKFYVLVFRGDFFAKQVGKIKWFKMCKNIIHILSLKTWFKLYMTFIKPVFFKVWKKHLDNRRPREDPIAVVFNVKRYYLVARFSKLQKWFLDFPLNKVLGFSENLFTHILIV